MEEIKRVDIAELIELEEVVCPGDGTWGCCDGTGTIG